MKNILKISLKANNVGVHINYTLCYIQSSSTIIKRAINVDNVHIFVYFINITVQRIHLDKVGKWSCFSVPVNNFLFFKNGKTQYYKNIFGYLRF